MPKFNYVAMDSRGKETKGTLDVANQNEAISRLKEMGYFPTKVTEAEKPKEKAGWKRKRSAQRLERKGRKRGSISISGFPGWAERLSRRFLLHSLGSLPRSWMPVSHCCAGCACWKSRRKTPLCER